MRRVLFASALLAGPGCAWLPGGSEPTPLAVDGPTVAADAAALCAPHGVLQAVCTQCNPALAAVFQANGDWCAEHGFAESFCPICHPERGGRPAVDVAATPGDGAPAHGTKVRFKTRETARLAGIETVPALESAREESVAAYTRIVYDATRVALVSAPEPGLVSAIRADVGAQVSRGGALATIQSASIGAARAQQQAARARLSKADAVLQRQTGLRAAGVASLAAVEEAEGLRTAAQAELSALDAQLSLVGEGSAATYTLVSPIAGEVTRREVHVGAGVEAGAALFEVVDPSTMWAELSVNEADLSLVAPGSAVAIALDTLPDRVFEGVIATIAPTIDPETRTATARVALANPDRVLRGNMAGSARILVQGSQPTVTVPSAAVQRAVGVDLVFVRLSEDTYEARRVQVRARQGSEVRLDAGVLPGESVVTVGSFLLKTETLKDSIGAGCCDVE